MSNIPSQYIKAGYKVIYDDEELRQAIAYLEVVGSNGGGGGGGGGDASAANQVLEIAKLTSIDNKLALSGDRLKTETSILRSNISRIFDSLVLVSANFEYSYALNNVKKYSFKILNNGDSIRFSNTTGKVATPTLPYYTLDVGIEEMQEFGATHQYTDTLYFASGTAGTTILIQTWS